jgi:glyoxylase-like metal-dependent hydrolase (beta-lactamase superfamily II)
MASLAVASERRRREFGDEQCPQHRRDRAGGPFLPAFDKARPTRPAWNLKRDDTFIRALAAAALGVDDIDFVMCTHMHVDHVGWNTRLMNGRWTPTFPKARHLFSKGEFDYWTEQTPRRLPRLSAIACFRSVRQVERNWRATTTRLTNISASCQLRATRRSMPRFALGDIATMRS